MQRSSWAEVASSSAFIHIVIKRTNTVFAPTNTVGWLEAACRNTYNSIAPLHVHNITVATTTNSVLCACVCITWICIWPWNKRFANHQISSWWNSCLIYLCNSYVNRKQPYSYDRREKKKEYIYMNEANGRILGEFEECHTFFSLPFWILMCVDDLFCAIYLNHFVKYVMFSLLNSQMAQFFLSISLDFQDKEKKTAIWIGQKKNYMGLRSNKWCYGLIRNNITCFLYV